MNKVNKKEVENTIVAIETDTSLAEEDRTKFLKAMKRTLSLLNSAADFREKSRNYETSSKTASEEAEQIQAELAKTSTIKASSPADDISLVALERLIQHHKVELADASTALTQAKDHLSMESTRSVDARNQQNELKKSLARIIQQVKNSSTESPTQTEQIRIWHLQAESEATQA